MAERDCSGVGSARRRKERRLRSWWRHERMTVAAELAVALHRNCGVGPAVPHEAPRGQTAASSGGRRRLEGARAAAGVRACCLPALVGCSFTVAAVAGRCGGRCCGPLLVGLPPQCVAQPEEDGGGGGGEESGDGAG